MPNNPNRSQIHIDAALTDISIAYMQDAKNFVNSKVFPVIPVKKQSDKYFIYSKGDTLRIHTQIREAGTESAGAGYDLDKDNYYCDPFALHTEVTDKDRDNADDPLDLDRDATEFVTQDILMKREKDFFDSYFTTGLWDTDAQGVGAGPTGDQFLQWDLAGSNPVTDVETMLETITSKTGADPSMVTLTLSPTVWRIVKNHAEVLDRIKHTQTGIVTEQLLAEVLGIKQVLVARGVYNSAAKGATPVVGYMAPAKSALLTYAPERPSMKKPSAGYTFNWTGYNAGESVAVFKFYIKARRADRIEVEDAYDQKLVASDCGVYIYDAIS